MRHGARSPAQNWGTNLRDATTSSLVFTFIPLGETTWALFSPTDHLITADFRKCPKPLFLTAHFCLKIK